MNRYFSFSIINIIDVSNNNPDQLLKLEIEVYVRVLADIWKQGVQIEVS